MSDVTQEDSAALWEAGAQAWTQWVRGGGDVYRDQHNTPAFLALLPPVHGLTGLDIGCGEGAGTRALAAIGARMTGADIAPTLVQFAAGTERTEPHGITYTVADAAALPFPDASFDFATAFMTMMGLADAWGALREAYRVVRPGGFLQFSILHPCFVPPHRRVLRDATGRAYAVEVGRYFDCAPHILEWKVSDERTFRAVQHHHTLSDWFNALVDAGWRIERVAEPSATESEAAAYPGVQDTRIAPLVMYVRVRR
ncbi:MAG TPA: class I SAM-dependent methyltransferase [Candidatus Lustribacter sp.]|jgi:ubiquinone/menaquinone biosynthesis C-methylase UbiE|nr:class I SAM-dependent methyltransferase [Candidatus Lustribacter sp.]